MRSASPAQSGMLAELYPNAEENPAVSKVFFRETVIFRDHGHPARAAARSAASAPIRARLVIPDETNAARKPLAGAAPTACSSLIGGQVSIRGWSRCPSGTGEWTLQGTGWTRHAASDKCQTPSA